ncbi:protein indeterminate-domain 7-like [Durio zibethinus]|uniref:Protein indeterminate-domain 7-like n=1 Tax=Durio zibethinus TaxID=66656 RepID=A0A6P5ZHF5_DURZI|nr:protein indeterminate-domain 7-like [Durio zibethinus]
MMKGLAVDESISNLTSASGEVSASSGTRIDTGTLYPQQSFSSTNQAPSPKKKSSVPGNPDPDAEVIALSPKTLLATNRFMCEVCNKGFQRDQNLQLHRRGHNLPWKLKQRTNKEVRKKVYVCPETTCVHHDPSRALGDLTGIKKHFCRKHGEKKWKCEKCSKCYAVQSDWKAHSKICGTREYRCDCGTVFSRRDSFITHRAFCNALAEESARAITAPNPVLLSSHQPCSSFSHMTDLQTQLHSHALSVKREQDHLFDARVPADSIPPWLACPPGGVGAGPGSSSALLLDQPLAQNENPSQNPSSNTLPPFQAPSASPHMSATALLQKAAQTGVTISKPLQSPVAMQRHHHQQAHMSGTTGFTSLAPSAADSGLGLSAREERGSGFPHALASFGNKADVTSGFTEQAIAATNSTAGAGGGAAPKYSLLHDMMTSLSSISGFDGSSSFEQSFNGIWDTKGNRVYFQETIDLSKTTESELSRSDREGRGSSSTSSNIGGNDILTRDFLGLKAFPHRDFPNLARLDRINSSSAYGQQNKQHQTPWQG